jgi:hypothetical protein
MDGQMASRSDRAKLERHNRSAAIQWLALVVIVVLAVLAYFVI